MKIRIYTTGFSDTIHSVDMEEAHKAYYLFTHPNERGIFNNGLALRGQDIRTIEPDYQGTMGWNHTHELDNDDWNEIRNKSVDRKMRELLSAAQEVSRLENPPINKPLSEAIKLIPERKEITEGRGSMKSIGDITSNLLIEHYEK